MLLTILDQMLKVFFVAGLLGLLVYVIARRSGVRVAAGSLLLLILLGILGMSPALPLTRNHQTAENRQFMVNFADGQNAQTRKAWQDLELHGYAWLNNLPNRVVQVDLELFQAVSQYESLIAWNFGGNACGLIAPAQAVMGSNVGLANTQQNLDVLVQRMGLIRANAIRADGSPTYAPETGIQPSDLAKALQASGYLVTAHNRWNLLDLYQALADGQIVIVDVQVQSQSEHPGVTGNTFAHYARVLGMDLDRGEIYLENTLDQRNSAYWTLTLEDFIQVWQHPETRATIKPSQKDPAVREEDVSQWGLVIEP